MNHQDPPLIPTPPASTSTPVAQFVSRPQSLKRAASSSLIGEGESSRRKRIREDVSIDKGEANEGAAIPKEGTRSRTTLIEDLEQELQCGCCSALVYRPVIVFPCQHFFCGSCVVLWIRNGGTNCPTCRAESTVVMPYRAIQPMIDLLLRVAPHKARPANERLQADEIYKAGQTMRLPIPREASPEPNFTQSADLAQPCPNCVHGNPFGWTCPQPIPDPNIDPEHAWHLDNGSPPGHTHCGNCENLLALQAPTTTKCDFCQVYFCGISVPGRCVAAPLISQQPHNMNDVADIILSADVYDCFNNNTVEVEIMLDYLTAHRVTPKHIYREIVVHTQTQPRGFAPLIELDIFADIHSVGGGVDPDPDAPRNRICRVCATEVLLWGLKEWWIRERQKGLLADHVTSRKDCPDGAVCQRQKDLGHAKEFNHIFLSTPQLPLFQPHSNVNHVLHGAHDLPPETSNPGGTDTQPATPNPPYANTNLHPHLSLPALNLDHVSPPTFPSLTRASSSAEVFDLLSGMPQ